MTSGRPLQSPLSLGGGFPVGFYSWSLPQSLLFIYFPPCISHLLFINCFHAYTRAVHNMGELRTEEQALTLSFLAALKA